MLIYGHSCYQSVPMLELLKKNIPEIIVIFLAVLAIYIIAIKTNTPVNSIHFAIMSTIYSAMGIFAVKMVKRSLRKDKDGKYK